MEIHQLKTFVAVAREGSITKAAATVFLSQPAVSAHIKALEDHLGFSLFERSARGMHLTQDGERLLSKAEGTISAHRALLDEANSIRGQTTKTLRVGIGNNLHSREVRKFFARFATEFPDVVLSLHHAPSSRITKSVQSGELDAGFHNVGCLDEANLESIVLGQFDICLAIRTGLFPDEASPGLAILSDLPWIYPAESTCCGLAVERFFKNNDFKPRRVISVDNQRLICGMVADGIGVGVVHSDIVKAEFSKSISLAQTIDQAAGVFFAYRPERARGLLGDAIRLLNRVLLETAA